MFQVLLSGKWRSSQDSCLRLTDKEVEAYTGIVWQIFLSTKSIEPEFNLMGGERISMTHYSSTQTQAIPGLILGAQASPMALLLPALQTRLTDIHLPDQVSNPIRRGSGDIFRSFNLGINLRSSILELISGAQWAKWFVHKEWDTVTLCPLTATFPVLHFVSLGFFLDFPPLNNWSITAVPWLWSLRCQHVLCSSRSPLSLEHFSNLH